MTEQDYRPDDRLGYFQRIRERVSDPDPTVVAYLAESLDTFGRGSVVASAVLLGVAAERVLTLVSESLLQALRDAGERKQLAGLLEAAAVKPRVDWVQAKLRTIQDSRSRPDTFPDNPGQVVAALYDFVRAQRGENGHPCPAPPPASKERVQAHLETFPRHYEAAERLREVLAMHQV